MLDRKIFFDKIRKSLFKKLTQSQVDGLTAILDEWEGRKLDDLRWLAYILATTYHESGHTMQPVAEYGKGKGRKYGIPDAITGHIYYGRGFSQITWKSNYEKFSKLLKVDIVNNPDLAMDTRISTDILFEGMLHGLFTGKKLADYFNDKGADWTNARRIINGKDCAELIAGYAQKFYEALK
jgi:putative chitinase